MHTYFIRLPNEAVDALSFFSNNLLLQSVYEYRSSTGCPLFNAFVKCWFDR